nr:hypothetical protein Iba_chr06dCG6600 [Ipomoea batatas]
MAIQKSGFYNLWGEDDSTNLKSSKEPGKTIQGCGKALKHDTVTPVKSFATIGKGVDASVFEELQFWKL